MVARVVLLGTAGGPPLWHGSDRRGISSAVVVGDRYYLIDAGYGVLDQVVAAELGNRRPNYGGPLDCLQGVFITHLHSDHVVDLSNVLLLGVSNGLPLADCPVPIWDPGNRGVAPLVLGNGPAPDLVAPQCPTPGTVQTVDLLVQAFAVDFNDRARNVKRPTPTELFDARDVPLPAKLLKDPNGTSHPRMSPVVFLKTAWCVYRRLWLIMHRFFLRLPIVSTLKKAQ